MRCGDIDVHRMDATSVGMVAELLGVEKTPGVVGGSACIVRTRIPVWMLEVYRRQGMTEPELLANFPTLRRTDLNSARVYAQLHRDEIELDIRENAEA